MGERKTIKIVESDEQGMCLGLSFLFMMDRLGYEFESPLLGGAMEELVRRHLAAMDPGERTRFQLRVMDALMSQYSDG